MKILDLPLKSVWYLMIESGVKKEEYRELITHWISRFVVDRDEGVSVIKIKCADNHEDLLHGYFYCRGYYGDGKGFTSPSQTLQIMLWKTARFNDYTHVRFRYGYTKRTMLFKLNSISIGKGNPDWGAPDQDVFILKLEERVE